MLPKIFRQTKMHSLGHQLAQNRKATMVNNSKNRINKLKMLKEYLCKPQDKVEHHLVSLDQVKNDQDIVDVFSPLKKKCKTIEYSEEEKPNNNRKWTLFEPEQQNYHSVFIKTKPKSRKRLSQLILDKNYDQKKSYLNFQRKSLANKISSFKLR